MKHENIFEAACYLFRVGFRYDHDYRRFRRGSWNGYIVPYKNGRARTRCN